MASVCRTISVLIIGFVQPWFAWTVNNNEGLQHCRGQTGCCSIVTACSTDPLCHTYWNTININIQGVPKKDQLYKCSILGCWAHLCYDQVSRTCPHFILTCINPHLSIYTPLHGMIKGYAIFLKAIFFWTASIKTTLKCWIDTYYWKDYFLL